jgi:hypothetical protein
MPPDAPITTPGLTDDAREEINKMLGTTVNNMITARLGTFEKKLKESLGGTMAETLKTQLPELLKDFKPADTTTEPDGKGGKRGKDDIETATLRKEVAQLRTDREADKQKYEAERAKNRASTLKATVTEQLAAIGITDKAKHALAFLQQDGRLAHAIDVGVSEDDDQVVFRADDGSWVDLPMGLKGWGKQEDARLYMAPSGVRGSGSRPANGNPAAGHVVSREQAQANGLQVLAKSVMRELHGGSIETEET